MSERTEVQVAIRLKQIEGYRFEMYRDNGPGGQVSRQKLNLETAKDQLKIYTQSAEATIVTRRVRIIEGPWEEVEISEVKQLAELLHKKQCHYNHTDQCDWEYGGHRNIHKTYEDKAKKMLETTTFETIKELFEIFKEKKCQPQPKLLSRSELIRSPKHWVELMSTAINSWRN